MMDIRSIANTLANELHNALKHGTIAKIGIDEVRVVIIGYLAASPDVIDKKVLIDATLRSVVENAK